MRSALLIQTAFLGDAILSTSLLECLKKQYPSIELYVVTRKGHELLYQHHPQVKKVWGLDKKGPWIKILHMYRIVFDLRKISQKMQGGNFDVVINLQRFASTGLLALMVPAKQKVGFTQNPFSAFYSHKKLFEISSKNADGSLKHEVQRNYELLQLISLAFVDKGPKEIPPKIYFGNAMLDMPPNPNERRNIILAPASVWATKEWPEDRWVELIIQLKSDPRFKDDIIYLVGSKEDVPKAMRIVSKVLSQRALESTEMQILAGKQSIVQTMLLMKKAKLVIANDSAPIHMASSVNAPTIAIFCSTLPEFGFYPIAEKSSVWEIPTGQLSCRPCGIHGKKTCPFKHFSCAPLVPPVQFFDTFVH